MRGNTLRPLWAKGLYLVAMWTVILFLSITAAQAGQVTLAWNASSGATGYHVYYRQQSGSYPATPQQSTASTTATVSNLTDGAKYYFVIRAHDGKGKVSAPSNEVSTTVGSAGTGGSAPTANFSADKTSGPASLTVQFTDQSTNATAWSWNFGDGATSSNRNPSKTYTKAGAYTVALTASNSAGSAIETKAGYITVNAPTTTTPVANFTVNPPSQSGTTATIFNFADSSTGTVTGRSWDFKDGTKSNLQNPVKQFTKAGTYNVTFTVSPGGSTATKPIKVTEAPPLADFSGNPTSGTTATKFTLTDSSKGAITTRSWKFGDGTTSTTQNPAKTYTKAGTYTVSLTTAGPGGSDTETKTNYITVSATTGLVAAYGFEEASGTTATDISGNGNHGVINGAARTAGKFGKALSFNGSNNWVSIPDADSLDLTTAMTLSAWIHPKKLTDRQPILAKQGTTKGSPTRGYMLSAGDSSGSGKIEVELFKNETSKSSLLSSTALNTSGWQHVAFVYQHVSDGASKMTLYINGVARGSSTTAVGPVQKNAQPLDLGRYYWNSSYARYFNGLIDEVRIYNRALSATEIQADMNKAVATSSPP